jgi:hypothetical protein
LHADGALTALRVVPGGSWPPVQPVQMSPHRDLSRPPPPHPICTRGKNNRYNFFLKKQSVQMKNRLRDKCGILGSTSGESANRGATAGSLWPLFKAKAVAALSSTSQSKAIFWSDGSESYLSQNRSPMNQRRPRCQIKNNISAGVPSPRAHRKRRLSSIVAPSIVCRQPSA